MAPFNKENDHKLKKLVLNIVKQILLVNIPGKV